MRILLPPSERKKVGGLPITAFPEVGEKELGILDVVKGLFARESTELLIGEHLLMYAGERFDGVVWREINRDITDRALSKVFIPNPITGIAGYYNLLPNYKMKLNHSMLDAHAQISYNQIIKNNLLEFFTKSEDLIIDLTTQEIRRFLVKNIGRVPSNVYSITYLHRDNKLLGHAGKKLKGQHAKLILDLLNQGIDLTVKDVLKLNPDNKVKLIIE